MTQKIVYDSIQRVAVKEQFMAALNIENRIRKNETRATVIKEEKKQGKKQPKASVYAEAYIKAKIREFDPGSG